MSAYTFRGRGNGKTTAAATEAAAAIGNGNAVTVLGAGWTLTTPDDELEDIDMSTPREISVDIAIDPEILERVRARANSMIDEIARMMDLQSRSIAVTPPSITGHLRSSIEIDRDPWRTNGLMAAMSDARNAYGWVPNDHPVTTDPLFSSPQWAAAEPRILEGIRRWQDAWTRTADEARTKPPAEGEDPLDEFIARASQVLDEEDEWGNPT